MIQRILQISAIAFFTILTVNLSAQNIYFGVQTGYGFATSAGQANLVNSETGPESGTYEIMEGGYGEGINIGIFGGCFFTENLGIELAANYLFGKHLTTENSYYYGNWNGKKTTTSGRITMLQLTPQLVFRANNTKLTPYAKVGLTFGFGTTLTQDISEDILGDPFNIEIESTQKSTGNMPVGFSSTLGATYEIGAKMDLFAEFRLLNMAYSPSKTSVTAHVLNGNNNLDNLTTSQKETIYLDKTEYDDVAGSDDKPAESLRVTLPLSSMSFNFGLRVDL